MVGPTSSCSNPVGIVVTVREVSTGREYNTHDDRLSNPIIFKEICSQYYRPPGVLPGTHANPRENPEEPEENLHSLANPAIAIQRSRHGRVLRPRRDTNFDYSSSFMDSVLPLPASIFSARDHTFALFAASLPSHANPGSSPLAIQGSAFPRLRKQLKESGERVFYVEIAPRTFRWYVMLKESGTIMVFDDDKDTFYNKMTDRTISDLEDYTPWSRDLDKRALTDDEVQLPESIKDLPGWESGAHLVPRYGYSEELQALVRAIAASKRRSIPQLEVVKPASTADTDTSAAGTPSGSTGSPAASTSAAETAAADTSVGATSVVTPAVSGVSVSVVNTTSGSGLLPPPEMPLPSVTEVSQVTPKPSVESTETMTEPVQAAVLASQPAALPSLVTASASARPSSLSGLAIPSRQTSEGTAETSLLTAAGGGAPSNDFFGQLIDANLQGALYEFLSSVGDQPTVDLPRLLKRIQELVYRLPEPLPQAQQSSSGETLREPEDAMEQDWVDDRRDDPIDEELQGELQVGGSEMEYLGSEPASGASSGTKGAKAAVTLFASSIISPKFEIAYASGIPGVTQHDKAVTSTPIGEGLVEVQTEFPPLLAALKPVRDKKKGAGSTHRHGKRPRRTSPVGPVKTASASLPLPDQGARPSRETS